MNYDLLKTLLREEAFFLYYRQNELWYQIIYFDDEDVELSSPQEFNFPVPISDTGTGVFKATMRAPELMRWIRKQLENIEAGKKEQGI